MSRAPIFIKDLVRGNQVWKMHVRIVDLWIVKEKSGQQHLELVIQDGKGDQIHVTTRSRDFNEWSGQLNEHQTYYLYNGEPVVNEGSFKVCSNKLKLLFNGGTTVTSVDLPDIPPHQFKFQEIASFLNGSFKPDLLYDVIGVLQDVVKTQMGGDGKKSCTNITLRDAEGNAIEVALWDDYAKQFMNYNAPDNFTGPTVIILTHAWCKRNSVSGVNGLSNAWNGSKLYINLAHPQVEAFKERFLTADLQNAPTHTLSLTSDTSLQSTNQSWTNPREVRTLRDIVDTNKDCYATTIGTTRRFKASRFGWYFETCPDCKAIVKTQGANFECECGAKDVEPITKFKIEVEVQFEGFNGTFVFWDKDCVPYTKMSAKEIRLLMREAGEDNPKIWPAHLDVLLNKEMAFRIRYQSHYQQFSIVTILTDDDVYNKLKGYLTSDEHTSNSVAMDISPAVPTIQQIQPMMSLSAELTMTTQPSTPANHSGSPTASTSSTPAKRVAVSTTLNDDTHAEDITPKQSVTKAKPGKKVKNIKKE